MYIVIVDWYNDEGHNLDILSATCDIDIAEQVFNDYVRLHRSLDEAEGYTIQDDSGQLYYAYRVMPEYHRVMIKKV